MKGQDEDMMAAPDRRSHPGEGERVSGLVRPVGSEVSPSPAPLPERWEHVTPGGDPCAIPTRLNPPGSGTIDDIYRTGLCPVCGKKGVFKKEVRP